MYVHTEGKSADLDWTPMGLLIILPTALGQLGDRLTFLFILPSVCHLLPTLTMQMMCAAVLQEERGSMAFGRGWVVTHFMLPLLLKTSYQLTVLPDTMQ